MSDFRDSCADYICKTFKLEDELLVDVLEQQKAANGPMMNIGADQGKLIELLIKLHGAKKALEIGSYFAYSTIWIARALKVNDENAKLIAVEKSAKQVEIIKANIAKAELESNVDVLNVDAASYLDSKLDEWEESFDLIFIDADKGNYPKYLSQAQKLLKKSGLLLVDNVLGLHSHEVLDPENTDKRIEAIRKFNSELAALPNWDSSIVSIHGGMAIGIKN